MRWVAICVCLAFACSKDKKQAAESAPEIAPVTQVNSLWELAPQGAKGGTVFSPAAITRAQPILSTISAAVELLPNTDAAARKSLSAILHPEKAGIDASAGGASFDLGDTSYAMVKVTDTQKFAALFELSKMGEAWANDDLYCAKRKDGWMGCVMMTGVNAIMEDEKPTADHVPSGTAPEFAKRAIAAMNAFGRGDTELYSEAKTEQMMSSRTMAESEPMMSSWTIVGGSLRGRFRLPAQTEMGTYNATDFKDLRPGATSFMAANLPIALIEPSLPPNFHGKLTGQIALSTDARHALTIMATAKDEQAAKDVTNAVCAIAVLAKDEILKDVPGSKIEATKTGCAAQIKFPDVPQTKFLSKDLGNMQLQSSGKNIVATIGPPRKPLTGGVAAGSKEMQALFEADHSGAFFVQTLAPPQLIGEWLAAAKQDFSDEEIKTAQAIAAVVLSVHSLGIAFDLNSGQAAGEIHVTTFAGEEPKARERYEQMQKAIAAGEFSEASKLAKDIAAQHPKSLAADIDGSTGHGVAVASAFVGVGAALSIPAYIKYLSQSP